MKAKEYAEKYKCLSVPTISDHDFAETFKLLFNEVFAEFADIAQKRHIGTRGALLSLKKEFNEKCNKISDLLGGAIKKDWFYILYDALERKAKEDKK